MIKFTKQIVASVFLQLWKLTGYRVRKITHFPAQESLKTIAIFSTTALGDFLLNTPAIRAIKQRWPESRILLVIHKNNQQLAESCPVFDEILYWDGKVNGVAGLAKKLRAQKVDAAFLLHSRAPYDIVAASLARSPVILKDVYYSDYLGRDNFYLARFLSAHYDNRIGGIHLIRQKTELLKSTGIEIPSLDMFIPAPFTPEKARRITVGLHPGTSTPARCWPAEKFTRLIQNLMTKYPDIDIMLTGGPGEITLNQKIIAGLAGDTRQVTNLAGATSLMQLVEKIASFSCLVVGDTGPLHIAIAVKTPVVALLGCKMYTEGASPLQDKEMHQVIMAEDESQGIPLIKVEKVFAAVEQCLNHPTAPAPGGQRDSFPADKCLEFVRQN